MSEQIGIHQERFVSEQIGIHHSLSVLDNYFISFCILAFYLGIKSSLYLIAFLIFPI